MKGETRTRLKRMIDTVEETYAKCDLIYQLYSQDPARTADMMVIVSLQQSLLQHLRELVIELNSPWPGSQQFENELHRLLAGNGISIAGNQENNLNVKLN